MEKPPSIAEILELEQVLHIMGINELDAGMRDFLLPFLAGSSEEIVGRLRFGQLAK
jgi:hypothetical protein